MTHANSRRNNRQRKITLAGLIMALLMALTGCVMPDGTVYSFPVTEAEAVTTDAETGDDAQGAQDADVVPSAAMPFIEAGRDYGMAGDLQAALAEFDQAVAAAPDDPEAYYFRGLTYAQLGDAEAALADLDRALALAPDYVDALQMRASVYGYMADIAAAAADWRRVLELTDGGEGLDGLTLSEGYYVLAVERYIDGDLPGTVEYVGHLLRVSPWDMGWYGEYSRLAQSAAQLDGLLADYDAMAADAASPGRAAYATGMQHLLRGRVLELPDEFPAAIEELTAAIEAEPGLAAAYHARGMAQILSAQYPQGGQAQYSNDGDQVTYIDQETGESVTISQDEYDAILEEAEAAAATAREAGIEDLTRAVELEPTLAEAVHDLGVVHFAQQEQYYIGMVYTVPDEAGREAALAYFDEAVALAPDWPQARLSRALASVHWANQDFFLRGEAADAAMADLEQTVTTLAYTALEDAEFLIEQGAGEGWPYYVRAMASQVLAWLEGGIDAELSPELQEQMDADWASFTQLSPNVRTDDIFYEAAAEVRLSEIIAPQSPLMASHVETVDGVQVLVHDAAGFSLQLPPLEVPSGVFEISVPDGPVYLNMRDDFGSYEVLVMQGELGELGAAEWLTEQWLPYGLEAPEEVGVIDTQYGEVTTLTAMGQTIAVLPVADTVFYLAYGRSEMWSDIVGSNASRDQERLADLIDGLTLHNQ